MLSTDVVDYCCTIAAAAASGSAAELADAAREDDEVPAVDSLEESAADITGMATQPGLVCEWLVDFSSVVCTPSDWLAREERLLEFLTGTPDLPEQLSEEAARSLDHAAMSIVGVVTDVVSVIGEVVFRGVWIALHAATGLIGVVAGIPAFFGLLLTGGRKRLLRRICDNEERLSSHVNIARLDVADRYVVVSDLHMFRAGSRLDTFGNTDNDDLYVRVLEEYRSANFFLIEAGDVEDLWERRPRTGNLLYGGVESSYFGLTSLLDDPIQASVERRLLRGIISDYPHVYGAIAAGFYQADRMVRMIGNHDLRLRRKRFAEEFRDYYPDLVVYDAVVLVLRDATGAESGYPQVVILHGHQFDAWNNPLLGNFAGQPIVDFGSGAFPDFTSGIVRRKKWRKRMDRTGFDNVLRFHLLPHLPERRIPRIMDKTFDADHPAPHLILGHTHAPKWHSRVRKNDGNAFLGYTNSGTAGRYEELLWCVEIDAGQVSLHTWFRDGDDVVKRRMEIDEDDGHLEPA